MFAGQRADNTYTPPRYEMFQTGEGVAHRMRWRRALKGSSKGGLRLQESWMHHYRLHYPDVEFTGREACPAGFRVHVA
ncbi:MAG: hypothetical protein F7C35_00375 [Desulfurococcales archaeon]|nr:hypothetical protein [Desulfurococcales archaeon]